VPRSTSTGTVVGAPGDYDVQTDQVIANCLTVLSAVGAAPADVVRSIIYVVSPDSTVLAGVWDRLNASPLGRPSPPPARCSGWRRWATGGQLIEVDLTAALPA
jgi:enamine deaminase RidA (YjgF/YER057c/UK114 family)